MRERFTDEQWEVLMFAPVWANYVTAQIDGEADERESRAAVLLTVEQASDSEDELVREVCRPFVDDLDATMARLQAFNRTGPQPGVVIEQAGRLVDSVAAESAVAYKQFIMEMCRVTAEASGPLVGPKTSELESAVIENVRALLNLDE